MKNKIPSVRQAYFLQDLEERFKITARAGKGSEIVLQGNLWNGSGEWRRYRLSNKKTHRTITSKLIEAILRRFKIPIEDYLNEHIH